MKLRDYQQAGIDDIREAFHSGIRRVCYVAPCGAGKGTMVAYMARKAAERGNRTLFLIHRRELLEQVQNDIGEQNDLIQLVTVQSVIHRLSKIPAPDLIISDEFHHGTAQTWRKIFDYFNHAFLVGLTATPQRTGGQGLGEICDKLIIGPSVRELIGGGFLAPYKYYAPPMPVDFSDIKIKMGDYDQSEIATRMDKPHITGQAIDHYKKLASGTQAIVYCASIQHSKNTVASFISAGINAAHVDGETPADERRQSIADFKSGRLTVMSNVELFGEGLNLPGVETVILLRPTQSLTLNVQQSMRSMRPGPGKTAIIIDAVGNCFRHGLPDDDREWSLESKRRGRKTESTVAIRVCPKCFSVDKPGPVCKYCGFEYPVEIRKIEQKPGELTEITAIEKKQRRQAVGMCRTIADLEAIAKERNYSRGWIYVQAKLKHIAR